MTNASQALIKRLSQEQTARQFGQGFAQAYFAQAFGSLPKSEVDLLVFSLLMKTSALTPDTPVY